jgi:hypothetical protein
VNRKIVTFQRFRGGMTAGIICQSLRCRSTARERGTESTSEASPPDAEAPYCHVVIAVSPCLAEPHAPDVEQPYLYAASSSTGVTTWFKATIAVIMASCIRGLCTVRSNENSSITKRRTFTLAVGEGRRWIYRRPLQCASTLCANAPHEPAPPVSLPHRGAP